MRHRLALLNHGAKLCRPLRLSTAGTRASRWVTHWQSCPLGQCETSCGRMLACTACTHVRRSAAQSQPCALTRGWTGQCASEPGVCVRAHPQWRSDLQGAAHPLRRYLATVTNHGSAEVSFVSAKYVLAAGGLLGRQYTPEERLMPSLAAYRGFCTLAGRADGRDSLVGCSNQQGKVQHAPGLGMRLCLPRSVQ